ncbi:MAG: threonine-phosphate decarboxylase [Deltaproteobacteria bacterium]|jgi:threonine-phosphate decarboxylase|nr:threonine-phosphate decarboxylase [Deltaproteobacteria bacterium]MBT4526585.1 threonine-phosphate decarboxylase [Deltaproteobacteria bacterium]
MNTQTNHLHGGNPNYFIRKFNLETKEFIDFSVNVNHFGPPEIILAAWDEFKSVIQKYPDISGKEVKKFYHHKFGLPEDSILTGNGSIECIYLVPRALKIKKVTIIQPSFFDYRKAFELINAKINMIQLSEKTEFSFPETDEIAKQLEKSDALIFGNPNNPTGTLSSVKKIIQLADQFPSKWFLIDEAFTQYVQNREKYSLLNADFVRKNIIVFQSLTKFYALPGLRLGIAFSHPETIARISHYKEPWTINGIAAAVCQKLPECESYEELTKQHCLDEQKRLFEKYAGLTSLKIYNPRANFFMAKWVGTNNLDDLIKHLLKLGIYIRDCRNFPGLENNFFRFAIRSSRENDLLFNTIQRLESSLI